MDPNSIIARLDRVSKVYKTKTSFLGGIQREVVALNRVSLDIRRGEIFGLVGQSGSGKTTTGRLIVKLEAPDQGKFLFEGQDVSRLKGGALKAFRRKVQMIFQDPYQSLNPYLSVYDAVAEPLIVHKIAEADARRELVEKALKSVSLYPAEDFFYRYPHQLSGGQRQRVAIARAIIMNPSLIVADEPTSMLDAPISVQIFDILLEIREKMDVTFVFITHSLAAARYLCDRIGVIYKGQVIEEGPAKEVIQKPRHDYTRALIDAYPRF